MHFRLGRKAAGAFAATMLALHAAPALGQDNGVVGSPELRDFSLPGTRVVTAPPREPQAAPQPERAAPAPRQEARPKAAPAPAPAPSPRSEAPAQPRVATPAPEPSMADSLPTLPSPAVETQPADVVPVPEPAADPALQFQQPLPDDDEQGGGSYWPALGAGLALLAGLLFLANRRRKPAFAASGAERTALPEPAAPPAPPVSKGRAIAAQLKAEEDEARPVIELEFTPERMVTTDTEATVHFALTVRNVGGSAARNIRIEASMFNASAHQQQQIAAFFESAPQSDAAPASLALEPNHFAQFKTAVVMPRANMRGIEIEGRPLFIPTVAVRALYQWGRGRTGTATGSYLVGIQSQKSPGKMGPFRLDAGPRIYRSVAGRQIPMGKAA